MSDTSTENYQKMVGREIARRRTDEHLSIYALAEKAGMLRMKLWLIEQGKPTNYPNLHKIAKALGCKVDDLLPKDVP